MDARVAFLSRGPGYGLFLTKDGAVLRLLGSKPATVQMKLVGGSSSDIHGIEPVPGKVNYLTNSAPKGWHGDIATYSRVRYAGVYPGIDLVYYGSQRKLEYDFTVAPGSHPDLIALRFEGVQRLDIDGKGDLVLKTPAGEVRQPRPVIFQEANGKRIPVEGGYVLRGKKTVGFRIGNYDLTKPLTIDPVLVYSTYFGGSGTGIDQANAVAVDSDGNAYITGVTASDGILLVNPFQTSNRGLTDGFVLKLDPTGSTVIYSTYFGGSGNDEGHSIAIDAAGNAYVTGLTSSSDFPTTSNAAQRTKAANQEGYLLKLNPAGNNILYATYLGGNGDDRGMGVAVDPKGGIYVTGLTGSTDFPVVGGFQTTNMGGLADVFVTKFGPTGAIQYSTYVGGRGNDQGYSIAVDAAGAAYVTGFTTSANVVVNSLTREPQRFDRSFPTANAFQSDYGGGSDDAFVFKLSPAGNSLEYSSYIGAGSSDIATRVAVNSAGTACITGYSNSEFFPLLNPLQPAASGGYDAFITCMAPDGKSVLFSTLFGGESNDSGTGIAFDSTGNLYVGGYTESILLPAYNALQGSWHGGRDGWVLKYSLPKLTLLYSTFLGGSSTDAVTGLGVDGSGNTYVVGLTTSTDFPINYPFQPENAGNQDAFIAKINASDVISTSNFITASQGGSRVFTTALSTNPVFGYATANVSSGSAPTGLEILSLVQNGITVSQIGIPAPELFDAGRVFVQVDTNTRSVITLANPNGDEASVNIYFTDTDGNSSNFVTQTIAPYQHFSAFVTDPPFSLASGTSGTITYTSTVPLAAVAFRTTTNERGDFILSATPVANFRDVADLPITIPQFADGVVRVYDVVENPDDPDNPTYTEDVLKKIQWTTSIVLMNPTEDVLHGEIDFFDPTGAPISVGVTDNDPSPAFGYEIPPRSFVRYDTPGTADGITVGSIRVLPQGTAAPQAHAILSEHLADITASQTASEAPAVPRSNRLYVETQGDFDALESGAIRSAFAIVNDDRFERTLTVRLELTNLDGSPTGRTATLSIPPHGQVVKFFHQVPEFASLPVPFRGILQITIASDSPHIEGPSSAPRIAVTGMRTMINERTQFLATTTGPLVENPGTPVELVFPHIAEGGGYSTEFIMINRAGQSAAGTLFFVTQSGTALNVTTKP